MSVTLTCTTCGHFQRQNELGGLCRRYAPHATLVTRFRPDYGGNVPAWPTETTTIWPPVNDKDHCGDHTLTFAPGLPDISAPTEREG